MKSTIYPKMIITTTYYTNALLYYALYLWLRAKTTRSYLIDEEGEEKEGLKRRKKGRGGTYNGAC